MKKKVCKSGLNLLRESDEKLVYPPDKFIFKRMSSHETRESLEDVIPILISLCISVCRNCGKYLVWLNGQIVYSPIIEINHPHPKLPTLSKDLYNEARKIYKSSSRSAAALLRLSIEELLINLDLDINKGTLPSMILQLSEKHRTGEIEYPNYIIDGLSQTCALKNANLSSGSINLNETKETALLLFRLVNEIAEELIERKERIKEFSRDLSLINI